MSFLNNDFMKRHSTDVVVGALLIIFLFMGAQLPSAIKDVASSTPGAVVGVVLVLGLFYTSHPIVGVLGVMSLLHMYNNGVASRSSGSPIEDNEEGLVSFEMDAAPVQGQDQQAHSMASNENAATLEEEVVSKMAPIPSMGVEGGRDSGSNFAPVLDSSIPSGPL